MYKLKSKNMSVADIQKLHVISTIIHELRTPLSVINSNIQLLENGKDMMGQDMQTESFGYCHDAIKMISVFLDDIGLINKINKGIVPFTPEIKSLDPFIRKLVKELGSIKSNRSRLIYRNENTDIKLNFDTKLMRYALVNLINNALKFSKEEIIVSVEKYRFGEVRIKVKDSGIGIPKDDLGKIFEIFYRGKNTGMIPGTGLGMSIVRQCMHLHGGKIYIDSKVGKGTEIIMSLPYEKF
ncbi:HAMP domain-containing histidine kinase [Puteibacter caeruleilacunae]|nr:HAMP domain-containing histidine kinase [Puteibacter caeruleilacunae]